MVDPEVACVGCPGFSPWAVKGLRLVLTSNPGLLSSFWPGPSAPISLDHSLGSLASPWLELANPMVKSQGGSVIEGSGARSGQQSTYSVPSEHLYPEAPTPPISSTFSKLIQKDF